MTTLHLNLIRHWFDMVYKRIKPEEYREIKPYWCVRLLFYRGEHHNLMQWESILAGICVQYRLNDDADAILKGIEEGIITFKPYDTVTFSNGMTPPVPRFVIERLNTSIDTGNPDWGAEKGKRYFVLTLGKIIKPL